MTENQAVCPVCEEYSGKPASVEAHITGKSDDKHRGKFGAEYRERIRAQTGDVTEVEAGDETGDEAGDETGDEAEGPSTGRLVAQEPPDLDRSQDGSESGNGSQGWLALLVAGAVALLIWVTGQDKSTGEPSPDSDTGPQMNRHE